MNIRALRVLFRKEILDLLRDRRTLISLVLAPMLVGPLMMSGMNYYMRRSQQQARVERFKVGVQERVALPGLREGLKAAGLDVVTVTAARAAVETKQVTFGVEVGGTEQKPRVVFYSDNSDTTESMARRRVDLVLDRLARRTVVGELEKRGVPASVLDPFGRSSVNVAQPRKMTGAVIGRVVGFLLLIFLFNGAMYAAVDTTAGEKERRTLEVLLSSSAGRVEIVVSKVLAALTTSFGTTVLSMVSYAMAFAFMDSGSPGAQAMVFPSDPLTLTLLMILTVPVAVMAASISVAAATPARSTREAMSYLTPGLFVVMALGMVTIMNERSTVPIAFIPFANFSQMLREVLAGEVNPLHYGLTIASNLVYSAVAVALAVRSFTSEKMLFRS